MSIQILEGQEESHLNYPPQNSFEGAPITRIGRETCSTIGRLLVDDKDNIQMPGVTDRPSIKEINARIGEVEQSIESCDSEAEKLSERRDSLSLRHLQQIQDDRDKLRIELELYRA